MKAQILHGGNRLDVRAFAYDWPGCVLTLELNKPQREPLDPAKIEILMGVDEGGTMAWRVAPLVIRTVQFDAPAPEEHLLLFGFDPAAMTDAEQRAALAPIHVMDCSGERLLYTVGPCEAHGAIHPIDPANGCVLRTYSGEVPPPALPNEDELRNQVRARLNLAETVTPGAFAQIEQQRGRCVRHSLPVPCGECAAERLAE